MQKNLQEMTSLVILDQLSLDSVKTALQTMDKNDLVTGYHRIKPFEKSVASVVALANAELKERLHQAPDRQNDNGYLYLTAETGEEMELRRTTKFTFDPDMAKKVVDNNKLQDMAYDRTVSVRNAEALYERLNGLLDADGIDRGFILEDITAVLDTEFEVTNSVSEEKFDALFKLGKITEAEYASAYTEKTTEALYVVKPKKAKAK